MTRQPNYKYFFDGYVLRIKQIEIDLQFWTNFLSLAIKDYKSHITENRKMYESIVAFYNISNDGEPGRLVISQHKTFSIKSNDLQDHCNDFFSWIMNLSLIRAYNSLEILLLQCIQSKYFPLLANPIRGRKQANKVIQAIKAALEEKIIASDSTNNRYLPSYIGSTYKSSDMLSTVILQKRTSMTL